MLLIGCSLVLLLPVSSAEGDLFRYSIEDKEDDVVYLSFKLPDMEAEVTEETDIIDSGYVEGKDHLDIRSARSYSFGDLVSLELQMFDDIVDDENTRYEFQGWYNDDPGLYLKFNFILSYSNGSANITYDGWNYTNVSQFSSIIGSLWKLNLPKSFFPDAKLFGFMVWVAEVDPETGINYIDSSEPIEGFAEEDEAQRSKDELVSNFWPYIVIALGIGLFVGFIFWRRGNLKNRNPILDKVGGEGSCPKCGDKVRKEYDFCIRCGEYMVKGENPASKRKKKHK